MKNILVSLFISIALCVVFSLLPATEVTTSLFGVFFLISVVLVFISYFTLGFKYLKDQESDLIKDYLNMNN